MACYGHSSLSHSTEQGAHAAMTTVILKMFLSHTMCAQRAVGQLNDHHDGSETSEPHSCLRGLQNLEVALWKFRSQTAGTWHGQPDQKSAVHARTTGSEKRI